MAYSLLLWLYRHKQNDLFYIKKRPVFKLSVRKYHTYIFMYQKKSYYCAAKKYISILNVDSLINKHIKYLI